MQHEPNQRATLSVVVDLLGSLYVLYAYVQSVYILWIIFVPEQPVFVFYLLFRDKDTTLWHSVLFMAGFELTPQPNKLQLAS